MKHPNRKAEASNKWYCKFILMIKKRRRTGAIIKVELKDL